MFLLCVALILKLFNILWLLRAISYNWRWMFSLLMLNLKLKFIYLVQSTSWQLSILLNLSICFWFNCFAVMLDKLYIIRLISLKILLFFQSQAFFYMYIIREFLSYHLSSNCSIYNLQWSLTDLYYILTIIQRFL